MTFTAPLLLCSKSPVLTPLLFIPLSLNWTEIIKIIILQFCLNCRQHFRPSGETENQNHNFGTLSFGRPEYRQECCQAQWFRSHKPFMSFCLTLWNSFPPSMMDSKTSCGLGKWRPSWLQKCARKEVNYYLISRPALGCNIYDLGLCYCVLRHWDHSRHGFQLPLHCTLHHWETFWN